MGVGMHHVRRGHHSVVHGGADHDVGGRAVVGEGTGRRMGRLARRGQLHSTRQTGGVRRSSATIGRRSLSQKSIGTDASIRRAPFSFGRRRLLRRASLRPSVAAATADARSPPSTATFWRAGDPASRSHSRAYRFSPAEVGA